MKNRTIGSRLSGVPPVFRTLFIAHVLLGSVGGLAACAAGADPEAAVGQDPMIRDVAQRARAVLSNRCFACHGPDEEERQGGFRLDQRASFLTEADSGEVPVRPSDPLGSELFRRIVSTDEDERMPPCDFGTGMSPEEVSLIEAWIRQGAHLPQHWSFVAPERPALPRVPDQEELSEGTHPVDLFVRSKLAERGMSSSPQATKSELIRRLSLDLTGLPPTPEAVWDFEQDDGPNAYQRLVDRLLASPAYGEHWARKWLDLARYADSAGYADDPPRTIWAFRDWVVRALNENQPMDQFTIDQIAGDLLPDPSIDQLTATAFHRNTLTNNEGGTNDEEFRNAAIVDRVNTTMAVWMGVTMACAQCHTHKYDPFTHEEYFQLFSVFNQSQDADRKDENPTVEVFASEQLVEQAGWYRRLAEIEAAFQQLEHEVRDEFNRWDSRLMPPYWKPLQMESFRTSKGAQGVIGSGGVVRLSSASPTAETDTYRAQVMLDREVVGRPVQSIQLQTLPSPELPNGGAGLAGGNFVLTGVRLSILPRDVEVGAKYVRVELPGKQRMLSLAEVQVFSGAENIAVSGAATQSSTDYDGEAARAIDGNTSGDYARNSTTHSRKSNDPWWELELAGERSIDRVVVWNRTDHNLHRRLDGAEVVLLDEERNEVYRATIETAPESNQSLTLRKRVPVPLAAAFSDYDQSGFPASAVLDGSAETGWAVGGQVAQSHQLTLVPQAPVQLDDNSVLEIELQHSSAHSQHLLGSFRLVASVEESAAEWVAMGQALQGIQQIGVRDRTANQQQQLLEFFTRRIARVGSSLRAEYADLEARIQKMRPSTSVPIMRELAKPRETFVQIRGNYKSLGKRVEPGTPAVFHAVRSRKKAGSLDRLDLARWLVDRENPLVARVWMNRLWESLFGIGIVRSSEEFGSQGDRPTHPELLDWLACEFMDTGWDQKRMLRLLVTSQTYRQTSQVSRRALEIDKDNVWLSRGPRVRLSAEMVRDQALSVAGLLSTKMFGPPVRPPQPDMGLKAAFGGKTDWQASTGEDRYRRGIYTTWRRSNPYPSMATFDAPSREVCTLRRDSTNTPLQALVTLNDPGFIEAAQALARRVTLYSDSPGVLETEALDTESKLELAAIYCTNRRPNPVELDMLKQLLTSARNQLSQNKVAAIALATDPLGPLPVGADPIELASFTAVCNVLLNLDEVLMKR